MFHAVATDATGNSADSGNITIIIDTVAPDAAGNLQLTNDEGATPVVVATDGATNDNTPVLTGTAEPGTTVTISDGTTVLGTTTVDSDGNWSYTTPTLDDGDHSITTTVTDAAGNTSPASDPITFSVDTVAPAAVTGLVVSDDVGDSQGPLASGATTDDSTPTLSGQAEAGTTVSIYDGTTLLGTVTAGTDGSWSYTPPALSNGDHSLTTTVTDAAGNVSPASPAFDLTVDAGLPPATSSIEVFDDTGSTLVQLADGANTHDNTPTLTGLAGANNTITLYNGDVELGTTTADGTGQWTFDTSALPDGTYIFHAIAADATGNTADSGNVTIIIDTVAPNAADDLQLTNDEGATPVVVAADGATNDSTPVFSGTAEPGSTVTVSDGDTILGTATVGTDGTWSFTTPTLTDGDHSLTTTVTDAAGNISPASDPLTFTVDTQAPASATGLQLSNDESGTLVPISNDATNDTTPVLTGTAEAGSTVTVSDGGIVLGTATAGSDGTWSFTPTDPLTEGSHSFTTTVTDAAGNVSDPSAPFDFTVDTTPPAIASDVVLSNNDGSTPVVIADGGLTNDSTPLVTGTAEPGSTVTISDGTTVLGSVSVDSTGNWSFTSPTLAEGDHSLTTTVTDPAGNISDPSAAITFTVDITAPSAANQLVLSNDESGTAVPITNGTTNDTTPVLSGTAEPGSTVNVSDNGTLLGTAAVDTDGNWSFTPTTPLDEGDHSLTTTVTDAAGNTGPASPAVDFTIDTTAPAEATDVQLSNNEGSTLVPIAEGSFTNDATPVLTGGANSAEAGSTVTILDGTAVLGTVTAGADGSWSFTTPVLGTGDHSISVTVTDPAGNTSAATAPITFTVDTTAPDAALGLQLNNDTSGTPVPIADGGTTNDTTPVLSGTAEANSTITISDGDTVLGTTTTDATGAWSYTPTLNDGDHSLTVTVTDAAGNISEASAPVTVTVDTVAPTVADLALSNDSGTTPVAIPDGGLTNDNTPVLTGTAEVGSTVTISDGATVLGTLVVDSTGTWSYPVTAALTDGTHTLSVTATDAAGNVSSPATISLDVDATPPAAATDLILSTDNGTAPVTNTEGTFTSDSTPLLSGTATAGDVINVFNGTDLIGSTTVDSNGQWTITLPQLDDASYTLSVQVGDAAGNLSTPTDISFTVDTSAPAEATIEAFNNNGTTDVGIPNDGITNDNTPLLSGTAEAGSLVTIYDANQQVIGTTITSDTGTWSFQSPTLSDGTHTLTATVTDEIGNVSTGTDFTITVDATAPEPVSNLLLQNDNGAAPVDIPNGGSTNDGTPVLSGTAEAGSLVTILNADNGSVIGTVTADATTGAWSFAATSDLPEGTYNVGITVTDEAGNVSATTNYSFTVDLTPPAEVATFAIYNNEGSSPVLIPNPGSTNDDTPVLRGTATPGTTINIYQDNVLVGTAEVADNGVWRYETNTLPDATYSYTVSVVDAAGNESALSAPYAVTIDTVVPEPVGSLEVTDNVGDSQGLLTSGELTDDNTPTFSGTAETGTTVSLYEGTTLLGTATITAGNAWTITPSALGNGTHDFSIVVTDAAGNVSTSTDFSLNIEAGLPPATTTLEVFDDNGPMLVQLADNASTNDNTPVLSGLSTAGDIITIYDGVGNQIGTTTVGPDNQWSFTPSTGLADGSHSFFVTITDGTGNDTTSDTINIIIDTVAPDAATGIAASNDNGAAPVAIPDGGETNDNTPLLTGTAEANGIVTIYDGDTAIGTTTASATGAWSFDTPTLTNGSHTFSVTVTDAAGNISDRSTAVTLTVDTHAPVAATLVVTDDVTDTVVPNQGTTNDATPTLSGTAEAGSTVTIYDGATAIGTAIATGGNWTFTTADLTDGSHTFTVTSTDAAGNVSVASPATTVVIDTIAPDAVTVAASNNNGTAAIPIPQDGSTNDNTPALTGTAEAGSLITISEGTNVLGTVTANSAGSWSFISSTLADGAHTLSVTATDAAGNVSTPSTVTFTVITTGPAPITDLTVTDNVGTITGALASGATTDDTTPTLAGTATAAGDIVTVYDGTTVLGTVTAGTGGAWTFTTAALANGLHPLSVTVTDPAGNTSAATNFPITVDTVAPTASTLVITNDVTNTVVPNGGSTNDTTPTLSGVAEGGSTVKVYDNGVLLGTTTAAANGAWSFTTGVLATGSHPLTVTATDAAGNVGAATAATVVIDTTAPAPVTLTASNNDGSTPVAIANNGITNDSTPALSGTAEAGSLVTISEGTTVLGTVTAGTNGAWSFTTATLANGAHTFSATATDAAGNVSTATTLTLTVDTVAPAAITNLTVTDNVGTITGTLANGARTDDNTPTLAGTTEANAIVSIYDGTTLLGTTTASNTGAWSYTTVALSDGAHPLTVTATDAAGNTGPASTAVSITVDTVAPAAATDLTVNAAGTTLTGEGEANATVTVKDADGNTIGTGTVAANGSFSVTLSSAQTTGATLTVTQTDVAGNVSPTATTTGAISIVAANDTNIVDYTSTEGSITNPTTSVTHTALLNIGLGGLLSASVLSNGNSYQFSVGADDTRTVTLHGSIGGISLLADYSLYLYEQQTNGSWALVSVTSNYLSTGILSLGTQTGGNVTYSNLGTGNYAVVLGAALNVTLLPVTTITTVSDITSLAVTVAATVTGNLLENDTSSVAGTIPAGTAVTEVGTSAVAASGNTVINSSYGTLTINSHGDYTYTLKAGLDIDTLPTTDTFTYSVKDASGTVTTATLTLELHDGASTTLTTNSLLVESASTTESDASGSIYGDSTTTHTGTLSIINEHGDSTTVSSTGTTEVTGDYGVLSIAANGSYTYALSADVNAQDITHKEVFSYSLAATDGTITTNSFTIDLHPTITGTTGADTITGSAYDDTITAGAGADTLVYHLLATADATGGNGHDTWTDFSVSEGDKIDVSNLLIGWNDSTSNVNDFVKVDHTSDGNTVLSIDRDGTGTAYSTTPLVTLEGVNASLEELLQQPHQNTTA
ncbi:Ig-like domain-containing protein [Serratia sp. M24T3]|uniref:Ig-like domain-containing protein n=1 Tax=Serratia sp. M24T3 TaxID=932213 RepID=UPI001ED980C6|nr:Ig-like domain-containing protein [Serratia sp. M24T3]